MTKCLREMTQRRNDLSYLTVSDGLVYGCLDPVVFWLRMTPIDTGSDLWEGVQPCWRKYLLAFRVYSDTPLPDHSVCPMFTTQHVVSQLPTPASKPDN